jgi:putative spermidine/putrescine transport system substrate-binding protein
MKRRRELMVVTLALALGIYASPAAPAPSDELIQAAKKEGQLTVIGLPRDWCRYGDLIDAFKTKYGLIVNELSPDLGSGDIVEVVQDRNRKAPEVPDVVDIGLSFAAAAKDQGLLQPYKVASWETIPDFAKDPDGSWYGNYYGVLVFEVNTRLVKTVPTDWSDLLKPEYANSVALGGDPLTANQAILGVYAAGLSMTEGNPAKAAAAGLKFFDDLNRKGNFKPVAAKAALVAQGTIPISIRWDYSALTGRDTLNGNPPIEAVVPKSGVVAAFYVSAISANAPHPNAAKLWMEHLYSDEGQLGWLKGYCHPIRFNDLVKSGKIPQNLLGRLPPAAAYEKAVFPTLSEQNAAKAEIADKWDSVVKVSVK